MSNSIFENLQNYPKSEIIGITGNEIIIRQSVTEVCPLCGSSHTTERIIYVPKNRNNALQRAWEHIKSLI